MASKSKLWEKKPNQSLCEMYDELLKYKADRIINDVYNPWGREFKAKPTGGLYGKRKADKKIDIHEKLFTASVEYVQSLKQVQVDWGWPDFSQQVTVTPEVWTLHIFIYL